MSTTVDHDRLQRDNPNAYRHWSYFTDIAKADECGRELTGKGFAVSTGVDRDGALLLRATKAVQVKHVDEQHDEVEEIVRRHGGEYDGGEGTVRLAP